MPIYTFQHPKTKKVIEVVQRMSEEHAYSDADGVQWNRIFTIPQAAFNTQINPNDSHAFVEKTRDKNYTIGQLWDMSAELSQKRGGSTGEDVVKKKTVSEYEKKTKKKHPMADRKHSTIFI